MIKIKQLKEKTLQAVSEDTAHSLSGLRAALPIIRVAAVAEAKRIRVGLRAQFELGVGGQQLVEVHEVFDEVELHLGRLIFAIQFQSLLKLVLGALVFAGRAQDEPPNDPALAIGRLFLDALPNLLDRLDHVALLELGEGPMHVGVVAGAVEFLGLAADVQRFLINHVDVEQEGEVVIGIRMFIIQQDAPLQVLDRVLVVTDFEVGEAEVVVQLGIVVLDPLRLLERSDRQHVLVLLVHGDAVIEEGLPRARMILLKVTLAFDGQAVPVLFGKESQADLFKCDLLLEVPLLLTLRFIIIILIVVPVFIGRALAVVVLGARRHKVVLVVVDDAWLFLWLGSLAHLAGEDVAALVFGAIGARVLIFLVCSGGRSFTTLRGAARILNQLIHVELAECAPAAAV